MPGSRLRGRVWRFAEFEFWEASRTLLARGEAVHLEGKPREVLACLLEQPQEVVSTTYLLDTVWPDVATGPDSVTQAVAKLRRIFGGKNSRIILTVSREGYRIAVPVRRSFQDEVIASLALKVGDEIPQRPGWRAVRKWTRHQLSPVWLAQNESSGEERVFKFALDGLHLRALQRELAVYRLLTRSLGLEAGFLVPLLGSQFEELPAFLESVPAGMSLLEWSETENFRALDTEARVSLAARVASSMALAHRVAVFHNDLKPSNLLLDETELGVELRVGDFGTASLGEPEMLRRMDISDPGCFIADGNETRPMGTEMYRAPEVRTDDVLPTALNDVYAVGVLLYQLVRGNFLEPPLPGWEAHVPDELLRKDIEEAAHVDPGRRIQTMADLAWRLNHLKIRSAEKEQEKASIAAVEAMERSLQRMRERRPWVRLAMVSLGFGLLAALLTAVYALHERNMERDNNAKLESMYEFLAKDVLGQANPYSRKGRTNGPQQTLADAVANAAPEIDGRFTRQEEIAARLHETIADSYKDRTLFADADREYLAAAKDFRAVGGDMSQEALIADLEREFADLTSMRPGALAETSAEFARERDRLDRIKEPSAALQAWETLTQTTILGLGPHPELTLGMIDTAVKRAEATPGFDPALLLRLKKQRCGTYVRLGDGANLERVSRELIAELSRDHEDKSPLLFPFDMYLEEAFYLQGKYPETIAQADRNFKKFQELGEHNQMTIATLDTRAAAEAQMERYGDALRDSLLLHTAAEESGDRRLAVGSLNDAATFSCRQGNLREGMSEAREVERQAGPGPGGGAAEQPMYYNGARFTRAECLLSAEERAGHRRDAQDLKETGELLKTVDVVAMSETTDASAYQGAWDVAMARLSLLKGDDQEAGRYAALAAPLLNAALSDSFERQQLRRVQGSLSAAR